MQRKLSFGWFQQVRILLKALIYHIMRLVLILHLNIGPIGPILSQTLQSVNGGKLINSQRIKLLML